MKLRQRIEVADRLGECVLWDAREYALWWTDIEGRVLHRLDWQSGSLAHYPTPMRLASFAFVEGRRDLLAAFDQGIALFDPLSGTRGPWHPAEELEDGFRLNDGRVDRQGRFWVGSMAEADGPSIAKLYRFDPRQCTTHLAGLGIANGLAFSADGRLCYFADSRARTIWRFAIDPDTGILSDRMVFARSPGAACPDGATVDSAGYLWSAQWGGGCVIRYAPDGRVDRILDVPVSQPTCVAFGGPNLDLLFVTSAQSGLKHSETGAGDLFVYNVGVRGIEESRFRIGTWLETGRSRE
jgi:sugar lactone lactonase YvrE